MINSLVMGVFAASLTVDYLIHARGWLPSYLVLLPEAFSAIVTVIVVVRLVAGSPFALDRRYGFFLVTLVMTIIAGFVIQAEPTGAVLAGIRAHLKFVPFFLLPFVFRFSAGQLRKQFLVLLVLFSAQAPLALYQRFVEFAHEMQSGDPVRGTATTSSALSMLMMCGVVAVVSLYLRGKLRLTTVVLLLGALVLPTTLNETKATLLLLPIAMIAPAVYLPKGHGAARRLLPIAGIGALAVFAFIATYNYLVQFNATEHPIGQFVGQELFVRYLHSGAAEEGANYIGRVDSLEFAFEGIGHDPFRAAFGLGAGNVSTSFMPQFDGQYASYYDRFGVGMTQITNLLWQVGFIGLAAYLAFYYFVFSDARTLVRSGRDDDALLGQIWVGVMLIMGFALIYKSVFAMNEIGYPLWFYSGVVAARVAERRRARRVRCVAPFDGSTQLKAAVVDVRG